MSNNFKINDRVAWMSSLDVGGPKVEFIGTILEIEIGIEAARVIPDVPQHGLTQVDMANPATRPEPIVKLSDLRRL